MGFFDKSKLKGLQEQEDSVVRPKIMIVDDESGNLLALSAMLEDDYEIIQACDGMEAFEKIESMDKPDSIALVISDQRMPRMSGTELFQRLLPIIPNTVRILLTAYTDVRSIMDSINKAKIYKFMVKPFDPDELLITIKRAVESYEQTNTLLDVRNNVDKTVELKTQELQKKYDTLLASQPAASDVSVKAINCPDTKMYSREFFESLVAADVDVVNRFYTQGVAEGFRDLIFSYISIDNDNQYSLNEIAEIQGQLEGLLGECLHSSDFLISWSSNECLVVTRYANRDDIKEFAEKLHQTISNHCFELTKKGAVYATCAVGSAIYPFIPAAPNILAWAQVTDVALRGLKAAMSNGGNQWVCIEGCAASPTVGLAPKISQSMGALIDQHQICVTGSMDLSTIEW